MSDDLSKVVFGDAIEMTGKRPAWLEDGIPMRWSAGGNPYLDVKSHECVNWGRDYPVLIRLPVDHAYYRQSYKPTPAEHANGVYDPDCAACREYAEPVMGNPISDDIAKRMEALVRKFAKRHDVFAGDIDIQNWCDEARAIVALLPKPVDADLLEVRRIVADALPHGMRADILSGAQDHTASIQAPLACLKAGRALERDSREG